MKIESIQYAAHERLPHGCSEDEFEQVDRKLEYSQMPSAYRQAKIMQNILALFDIKIFYINQMDI